MIVFKILLNLIISFVGYILYAIAIEYILDKIENPCRFYLGFIFRIIIPYIVLLWLIFKKL